MENIFSRLVKEHRDRGERSARGYTTEDVKSIDKWFLRTVPDMLDDLRRMHPGYPDQIAEEVGMDIRSPQSKKEKEGEAYARWEEILAEMAHLLREASEETCSKKNPYEEEWKHDQNEYRDKYYEAQKEIWEYREACKTRGLELFQKWFWDLWM